MMTADALPSWPPEPDVSERVAAGVRRLLAPNASSWTYEGTNSYVIADGDTAILVDPGCENAAHHEALREAGRAEGRTVSGVLLTHDHPDHSDGARALAASLDVPIIARSPRFADQQLVDRQVLRIGRLEVQVVHTPGHSDDSVCLWMPEHNVILTGDTVLGARSSTVMGSIAELFASLERLRALVGERNVLALPGHGPAFRDLAESAARVIAVRTSRIDEVRRHIGAGVTSLEGLSALLYPQHSGSRAVFAVSTVASTVKYLLEQPGDSGIADEARRHEIAAELDRYERMVAARIREHQHTHEKAERAERPRRP